MLPDEDTYYQSLIGILRWTVELGRANIAIKVSKISSHAVLPRKGHLNKIFYMFGYLKHKHNRTMVFDPTYPQIKYDDFTLRDWSNFYSNTKEIFSPNYPLSRGKSLCMVSYVGLRLSRI